MLHLSILRQLGSSAIAWASKRRHRGVENAVNGTGVMRCFVDVVVLWSQRSVPISLRHARPDFNWKTTDPWILYSYIVSVMDPPAHLRPIDHPRNCTTRLLQPAHRTVSFGIHRLPRRFRKLERKARKSWPKMHANLIPASYSFERASYVHCISELVRSTRG